MIFTPSVAPFRAPLAALSGVEWLFLRPDKWNRHVQYAWRYDPCELASRSAARAPQRAPRMDPVDPWVTDDEYDPSDDFE